MTEKLYERDSFLQTTECQIMSCSQTEEGNYDITLDRSIFFPEEGGQYADTGTISVGDIKAKVLDGRLEGEELIYLVDREIPVGTVAICQLDWVKRFMRMQQHSGEHLLTGMIHKHFGLDNIGFHLSDDSPVTLVMNGILSYEQIKEMEILANQAIYQNLPFYVFYPSKEELRDWTYRSKIEIEGQLRLVQIGKDENLVDTCACCAPHVESTGQIGLIKVVGVQKFKGGTQVSILCGDRALKYVQQQYEILTDLSRAYSTSPEKLPEIIEKQKTELAEVKYKLGQQAATQLSDDIAKMPDQQHQCYFVNYDIGGDTMKNCYNLLVEKCTGYAGVFVGSDEAGYRYYAGSRQLDSRQLANQMRQELAAKGGGSAEMIQGKVEACQQDIEAFFNRL